MSPLAVLRLWFAAHERRDEAAARDLVSADLEVVVPGARLVGFEALMGWYRERAETEGPSFGYVVEDVLAGEHHAAALLRLHLNAGERRQIALYRVADDKITAIWAAEDALKGSPQAGP